MSTQAGTLPNKTETVTPAASKEGHVKLSWREKICYGFGDFGNGFMFDLGQAYLTKYWIDVCTIPAAAVAGIFAFTKIFDAFMDPSTAIRSPGFTTIMLPGTICSILTSRSPVPSSMAARISARAASSARL